MIMTSLVKNIIAYNFLFKLYKHYMIDSILIVKRDGFKTLIKQRGTKFIYIIIGYYAVRDSIIYLIIPYLIATGIF